MTPILIAQHGPQTVEDLFRFWPHMEPVISVRGFCVLVAVISLFITAAWLRRWHKQRQTQPSPALIFRRIADHLGLSLREQWLLKRIAHYEALISPLTLIVAAGTFDHHTGRYAQSLTSVYRTEFERQIAPLRRKLFEV